jgi:hypothetical protein
MPEKDPPRIPLTGFRTDKASSRLILLALASLGPKDRHGEPLDLAAMLEESGVRAVTEFVPGRRSHAATRGFWPYGEYTAVRGIDPAVLDSHLISAEMAEPLVDINRFIQLRGSALRRLVNEFLGSKLEINGIVRPPLLDLIATGNAEDD